MDQNFGTPIEQPKKNNTTLIIIIIVVVVLLCCCCVTFLGLWALLPAIQEAINSSGYSALLGLL